MKSRFIIYMPTYTREVTAVSMANVAGVPLFLRSVLELAQTGERSFTMIAPTHHRKQLLKIWQKVLKKRDIHLNLMLTGAGNTLQESDIAELKQCTTEVFYIINSNYVLPGLAQFATREMGLGLKIGPNELKLFKLATKQLALIGANAASLDEMANASKKEPLTMEEQIQMLALEKNRHYFTGGDDGLIVQKFTEISVAEEMLAENIRKNTGTWVAREINKRISLPFSLILAKWRVTPNLITVVNMFIGLCAGIGAAGITYTGVLLGGILFQLASIIDGCDGEVAKLTYKTSKFGQYIDSISDNLSLAAFLTGMMIHQWRLADSNAPLIWGVAILVGAGLILLIMAEYLKKNTDSASFVTFDKQFLQKLDPATTPWVIMFLLKYFKALFKKDLFSLMFLGFAILGILHWWFYMVAIGIWVAVAVLLYLRSRGYNK